jgi:hypothetical protein
VTRAGAFATLAALAHGCDAARLLERVAAHDDADELRAVLLEAGARAVVRELGGAGPPRPGRGGSSALRGLPVPLPQVGRFAEV